MWEKEAILWPVKAHCFSKTKTRGSRIRDKRDKEPADKAGRKKRDERCWDYRCWESTVESWDGSSDSEFVDDEDED